MVVTVLLRCSGAHRYKWIQNRTKERVHASQVFPAACCVLIATLKAHLVYRHTKSQSTLCSCSSFLMFKGASHGRYIPCPARSIACTLCQIAAYRKHAGSVCQIYRVHLVGYWEPAERSEAACRHCNGKSATHCKRNPSICNQTEKAL